MQTSSNFSGARIRQARHEAGLTQAALAAAAGTRERNIIRWENDQHSPRFDHIVAIAKATGKEIDYFAVEPSSDDDEEPDPVADLFKALERFVDHKLAVRA